ncbi:MAG: hypothetical protein ACJAXF_003438 [Polaribacter sp.]|jgi:hypothetical protein
MILALKNKTTDYHSLAAALGFKFLNKFLVGVRFCKIEF